MNARQWLWLIAKRVIFTIPILFGVATATFFLTRLAGGDPAYQIAGAFATEEVIAAVQADIGTDRPLGEQYVTFLGDIVRGDLGTSIFTGRPVISDLADRLPATLTLVVLALAFSLVFGLALGSFAAHRRGRTGDKVVRVGSFSALSVPDFWLGLVLLFLFFFRFEIAPGPTGQTALGAAKTRNVTGSAIFDAVITLDSAAFLAALHQLWLPLMTMVFIFTAPITRLARSAVIESLTSDAIGFGRACGLPKRQLWAYATRAALPPVVTFVGILFSVLLSSAVLVEAVFSWGGAAEYAVSAIRSNDFPAIQGFVLVSGVFSVAIFLVVDLLYRVIDPRVRL